LEAPDREVMLDWLRHQRMARLEPIEGHEVLMVHAGVLPAWSASKTIALAGEVEAVLQSPEIGDFLHEMYGDEPSCWNDDLTGNARLRVVVNALTRLRFCTAQGEMEFAAKESAASAPAGFMPWFEVPQRQTRHITVAFGHWSTLGWLNRADVLSLDTGCVWGGCLSALRVGGSLKIQAASAPLLQTLIQVKCDQAQVPG
jgi:bis(5'-nucleosyl)-tetraphosphatase (symmetrical)